MKIDVKMTPELEQAEAARKAAAQALIAATEAVTTAEQRLSEARATAAGLVLGQTVVSWKARNNARKCGVVVGLDSIGWPIVRVVRANGTLGDTRSVYEPGEVLPELWEGEAP